MTYLPPNPGNSLLNRWRANRRARKDAEARIALGVAQMRAEQPRREATRRTLEILRELERMQEGHVPVARADLRGRRQLLGRNPWLILSIASCTLATLTGLWWRDMRALPALERPARTLPSPNARDFFVQAGRMVQRDALISAALERPRPASRANLPDGVPAAPASHSQKPLSLANKQALLRENAAALAKLREGFAYPFLNPAIQGFDATFPELTTYRSLAHLLRLEGQLHAEAGNWNAAMSSYLDAMLLGNQIPRGGVLITCLVGVACEAIGRADAWETISHLNAPQLRRALTRLQEMENQRTAFADVLQEEYLTMRSSLIETFKKPDWVSGMTRITGGGDSSEARWQAFGMQTCLLFISRRRILDNMQRAMESEIARARRPYQTRLEEERDYGDPITNMIMPVFSQGQFLEAHTRTQNAMLALAVALRLYKLEQGRYPDTLSELQTKRFPMLAHDPFAGGAPFRYRKQGETFVLYSIGPDGVDDLGKPIQNPDSGAQRLRYLPNAASRGDIVLGTNSF